MVKFWRITPAQQKRQGEYEEGKKEAWEQGEGEMKEFIMGMLLLAIPFHVFTCIWICFYIYELRNKG